MEIDVTGLFDAEAQRVRESICRRPREEVTAEDVTADGRRQARSSMANDSKAR